jgi:hypothetical protein
MMGLRRYAWSLGVSTVLTALVVVLASVPHCSAIGVILSPGALLAAIVFPEGPHSSQATLFLILAVLIDIALFAFPVMWTWALIERRRKAKG